MACWQLWLKYIKNIARTVRLSIRTISGEDLAGANASEDALSIRKDVDFQTRDNMLINWDKALKDLTRLAMMLYFKDIRGKSIYIDMMDELEVNVEFYNPAAPTFDQIIKETRELLDGGLIDEYEALVRVWVDFRS